MRSKLRMVFVALVAVFAISAVAASSALASPEWYAKKAGVWTKLTTSLKISGATTFELKDTKGEPGGPRTVKCGGELAGVISAGGKGEVTSFTTENSQCQAVAGCENVETREALHLPWHMELYTEGSEIRDKFLSGSETPEWEYHCQTVLKKVEERCGINTSTHITNNAAGFVEATFDSKSAKTTCKVGGKETGEWKGVFKIEPTKAEKTAGVEAIKAE